MTKPFLIALCLLTSLTAHAVMSLGPWVPQYKGVDRAIGTNTADATFPRVQSVNVLRIDLLDPDVRLLTTTPPANYVAEFRETIAVTTSNFLKGNNLQVAINANFFNVFDTYNEGDNGDVEGLSISRGIAVSPQEGPNSATVFLFTTNNQATVIHTNWPATNTAGIYTAVAGAYPLVIRGVNYGLSVSNFPGYQIHDPQPRTLYGISQNRRYLYLITIDGRQGAAESVFPPYSESATDFESATWLILAGAYDGMNMDGGGSVTMVKANNFNLPYDLNHSSYIAAYGRERSIGSHFGVYAKPLPGFINDLAVSAADTNATITWTTISNSTSQVEYGSTTNLGTLTTLNPALVTNHTVTLTGLSPNTDYFYRVISVFGGTAFYATNRFVTSISTVSNLTVMLFNVTNSWRWNTNNLSATNWMARTYNDSGWSNGPGLLYLEDNAAITPKNTPLPPNNGVPNPGVIFPFPTYYFRTSFVYSNNPAGATLLFTNRIDDGAVFYLNGVEIQRVRMDAGAVTYTTLTSISACNGGGDATCEDVFTISGNLITNLVTGTNVLAVEVHQVATTSSDIVFGAALAANYIVSSAPANPKLAISRTGNITTLSWPSSGFTLQQTPQMSLPTNVWTDVPGPITNSPFSITNPPATKFYRLRN